MAASAQNALEPAHGVLGRSFGLIGCAVNATEAPIVTNDALRVAEQTKSCSHEYRYDSYGPLNGQVFAQRELLEASLAQSWKRRFAAEVGANSAWLGPYGEISTSKYGVAREVP